MDKQIKIMVASTVYDFQDQLTTICSELTTLGYKVLNSHIGSIKVNPKKSNLQNCLAAVNRGALYNVCIVANDVCLVIPGVESRFKNFYF